MDQSINTLNKLLQTLGEETDRGLALSIAAFAEECLERLLKQFMADVPATSKLLDGYSAPLGTFSSKINAASALGLCNEGVTNSLNTIRSIRNDFAHTWEPLSFSEQSIRDKVNNLKPAPAPLTVAPQGTSKDEFQLRASFILIELAAMVDHRRVKKVQSQTLIFGQLHDSREAAEKEAEQWSHSNSLPARRE